MKKISKHQKRMKSFERFELQYAGTLMQTNQWEEAYETLLPILYKHPYDIPTLQMMNDISFEVDDMFTAWLTSYRLMELLPDESTSYLNAMSAAGKLNLAFTVVHLADLYLKRWGQEPDGDDVRKTKTTWESVCAEIRKHDPINTNRSNVELSLLEQGNLLIGMGEYEEGRKLCQKAIELMPDVAAPYNNLSLSYAVEGNLTEALRIAQQTVERFPNNFHARCNLAQFLARTGRQPEAEKLVVTLHQELPPELDSWEKLIETFSYVGNDNLIVSIYKQRLKEHNAVAESFSPMIRHLIAVGLARTGDRKAAEKLWKTALKDDPNMVIAEDNLEDIKYPPGEQNGPWSFPINQWFPRNWIEQLADLMTNVRNEQIAKRRTEHILRDTLGMETALQMMLERGDPVGRELAIQFCSLYPLRGLAEFVQSANGTDEQRMKASEAAVSHGLLPRGETVKMYQRGKQTDLLFLNYEIHGETDRKGFPKAVQRLYEQSAEAVKKKDFDLALRLAQEALTLLPNDPAIMYQIALSLIQSGKQNEGAALMRQDAELHPDYLFARCGMANLCVQDGKLEEAKQWLAPLLQRARFHFSEFQMLAYAQIELLKAEGNKDAARSWLNMLEQMLPNAAPVGQIKRRSWLR